MGMVRDDFVRNLCISQMGMVTDKGAVVVAGVGIHFICAAYCPLDCRLLILLFPFGLGMLDN